MFILSRKWKHTQIKTNKQCIKQFTKLKNAHFNILVGTQSIWKLLEYEILKSIS
jgi:predicted RNase H-related nuclease YkuK (DUF458 family)